MNGYAQNGNVCILGHTYANCVDHIGAQIFYAALAVKILLFLFLMSLMHLVNVDLRIKHHVTDHGSWH